MPPKHHEATASEKMLGLYTLLLLSTRAWSMGDLASHFSCSKPTIMRLLERIASFEGVTLKSYTQTLNGRAQKMVELQRHPQLDSAEARCITITPEEMMLLQMCRDIAKPFIPKEINPIIDSSLLRTTLLMDKTKDKVEPHFTLVKSAFMGSIDYTPFNNVLQYLLHAINSKHICEIHYAQPDKLARIHEMAVTSLLSGKQALYVRGWLVNDKGTPVAIHPLFLALHRITSVIVTRRVHNLPPPPEEAGFGIMEGKSFHVKILITGDAVDYVRERIFSPDQRIEECCDGIILSFSAKNEYEVLNWIFSFTSKARVVEPSWLVDKARNTLNSMMEQYQHKH